MDLNSKQIRVIDVPARKRYGRLYDAALALEPGNAKPVPFKSEKKCRLAYEAFRQWALREGHSDLTASKRGLVLYVERSDG